MVDWLLWVAVTICIAVILVTPLSKLPPPMEDAALFRLALARILIDFCNIFCPLDTLLFTPGHQSQRHSICYRGVCCCGGVDYTLLLLLVLCKHQCAGSCYMCCHRARQAPTWAFNRQSQQRSTGKGTEAAQTHSAKGTGSLQTIRRLRDQRVEA